jgi:hypothetical protein
MGRAAKFRFEISQKKTKKNKIRPFGGDTPGGITASGERFDPGGAHMEDG